MEAYRFMCRIFPRSFTAKVFCIAFLGIQLPLIAILALILGRGEAFGPYLDLLLPIVLATFVATIGTLIGLMAMLRPLFLVERSLRVLEEEGDVQPLPGGYRDVVGRLMSRVNRLALRIDERLGEAVRRADTDPLTGLLNRAGLRRHMPELARGAVLFLDIDHFKAVNDTLGHDAGDKLLLRFALVARGALRRDDVLARIGGEEFVAFLPGADAGMALSIAERLRLAVEGGLSAAERAVTVSIGVAAAGDEAVPTSGLVTAADGAAYDAKLAGRNRVRVARPCATAPPPGGALLARAPAAGGAPGRA